jgi:RNA polymerase sigma-32 factor
MESRLQFNDVTFEISNDEDNSAPERYLTNTK